MTVAFALQSRISAIQSAAVGGQIFARALLQLGRERGVVHLKEGETYVNEAIAWTVAVLGATLNQPPAPQVPLPVHVLSALRAQLSSN